jgi:hypothetical protein
LLFIMKKKCEGEKKKKLNKNLNMPYINKY